jgi:hypothetical protein
LTPVAQAVVARKHGDEFQARLFWLHAAQLLNPSGPVVRVGYETGPKAFDDVLVEYDPARAPQDHQGLPILRDHFQCKWHVRPGEFGYADLTDPSFISATSQSFLQRARNAQLRHAPQGTGARFKLTTNWRLAASDPLAKIIQMQWHALDLDALFDGTTDASAMGKLRKAWREHLAADDAALRRVARTLGISVRLDSGDDLRAWLNDRFAAMGMLRVPADEAGFFYDDVIAKLHAQGRSTFDRQSFKDMCASEKLLDTERAKNPATVGVRSFMHLFDNLEARCDKTPNLVPHFEGRYIRDESDWAARIQPALRAFIADAAQANDHFRLVIDVHVSLAFGVGAILNVKSGKTIEIEQRTLGGRQFWSADDRPIDATWPKLDFREEAAVGSGSEVAVAIGLTHDIGDAVRHYVKGIPEVGRLLLVTPEGGPSGRSVKCGHHASLLAEALTAELRARHAYDGRRRTTHLFIAGPNAFAFFLGQRHVAIGPTAVYEWDFEGRRGGTYSLGFRT